MKDYISCKKSGVYNVYGIPYPCRLCSEVMDWMFWTEYDYEDSTKKIGEDHLRKYYVFNDDSVEATFNKRFGEYIRMKEEIYINCKIQGERKIYGIRGQGDAYENVFLWISQKMAPLDMFLIDEEGPWKYYRFSNNYSENAFIERFGEYIREWTPKEKLETIDIKILGLKDLPYYYSIIPDKNDDLDLVQHDLDSEEVLQSFKFQLEDLPEILEALKSYVK